MEFTLKDRLAFACDVSGVRVGNEPSPAEKQIALFGKLVGWVKVNSAFVGGGHDVTNYVADMGTKLWADLKWHDVPTTLSNYTSEGVLGVRGLSMFNVHAQGGPKMMKVVKNKLDELFPEGKPGRPLAIAITILTSIDEQEFKTLGYTGSILDQVLRLAELAKDAGLDGVVASPREATAIKKEFGPGFLVVTTGIRFPKEAKGSQARVTTPKDAIIALADIIVMGTPLIEGGLVAVERAYKEIEEGLFLRS
jgi:orotidine-5'-phosphate decarboxylase